MSQSDGGWPNEEALVVFRKGSHQEISRKFPTMESQSIFNAYPVAEDFAPNFT